MLFIAVCVVKIMIIVDVQYYSGHIAFPRLIAMLRV